MNVDLDLDLVVYGVVLVGLGVLAHWSAPAIGQPVLITGIAGGSAAVFWGVLGLRGFRRRIWPVSTLIILDVALLAQTIRAWLEIQAGNEAFRRAGLILTVLLVFGLGQLVNFVQERRRDRMRNELERQGSAPTREAGTHAAGSKRPYSGAGQI